MPKKAEAALKTKLLGGTIYVRFDDPRSPRRKQVFLTTKTKELKIAERIRDELTRLIRNPNEWNNLPAGLHPRTVEIWRPVQREVLDAIHALPLVTKKFVEKLPDPPSRLSNDPEAAQVVRLMEMEEQIRRQLEQVSMLTSERDRLAEENTIMKAQLRRMNVRAVKRAMPKNVKQCVAEFFKNGGTSAQGQWRYILECWFNKFAKAVGNDKDVNDIEPVDVIRYIQGLKIGDGTKLKIRINILSFLQWATGGQFEKDEVTKALRYTNESGEWYWLERTRVEKLIENLSKRENGQYWADAAMLQYGCGFRPEELPLLQRSKVHVHGAQSQIEIGPIKDGTKIVRRVKTEASADVVVVPSFAVDALQRRLAVKEFLLFPSADEWLPPRYLRGRKAKDGKNWKYMPRSKFEHLNRLWPPADEHYWSDLFCARLRVAAQGIEEVDVAKIDSRVLRRTCARELVLKYGLERAASVLRDRIETLKKHYANLQASDTSTER